MNGSIRQFSFSFSIDDNKIELYEFLPEGSASYKDNDETDIDWVFETPVLFNSDIKPLTTLCQLRDGEVYLSNIKGNVHVAVYYKPDFYPCWTLWREFDVCSNLSGTNANPSYRMRIGLGEPSPDAVETGNNRPLRAGYFFQCRVVVTGSCTWNGMRASAIEIPTPVFAPIEEVEQSCQAIDCVVPDDLRVYSLQGLPPQPLPPVPPPQFPFFNEAVYYNNVCSAGSLSFTGTLPNWITLEVGNNQFVGAANTFGGLTVESATAAAQTALNQFVQANLVNGNISCECEFDTSLESNTYGISPYHDGLILPPSPGTGSYPVWDGSFTSYDSGLNAWVSIMPVTISGWGINCVGCVRLYFYECSGNVPKWRIRINYGDENYFGIWEKTGGTSPIGTYTYVPGSGVDGQPDLTIIQLT